MKGLCLDVSMSKDDDVMGSTFRQGGLSVGGDHLVSSFLISSFSVTISMMYPCIYLSAEIVW